MKDRGVLIFYTRTDKTVVHGKISCQDNADAQTLAKAGKLAGKVICRLIKSEWCWLTRKMVRSEYKAICNAERIQVIGYYN